MQSQSEGACRSAGQRLDRISFVSAGGNQSVVESLREHYQVKVIERRTESLRSVGEGTGCLVVDAETFRAVDNGTVSLPCVPIVVFSAVTDPKLAQAVARDERCDIVYRDATGVTSPESASERDRLRERIDTAYAESEPQDEENLRDTVLETAGLLMSAAPDEVDTKIEWGIGSIAEVLGAERSVVYEHDGDRLVRTHEWQATGLDPLEHETTRTATFPGFEGPLSQFESFWADGELPSSSESANESLSRLGYGRAGSFVAVPIVVDWTLQRVLVIDGIQPEKRSDGTESHLQTAGELIGQTLRRNRRHREIERQNERLERFASVISHDLKNPLNVITGYTDLARESGDTEHIDRIAAAAQRMEDILDDLRTLTRQARDLGEREHVAVSEVAERASRAVDTKKMAIEIEEIGTIEADPSRLQQAFENLFRNSVEHAGSGVTVRVEPTEEGFAVVDDGIGFAPEDREQLFVEGYTGDDGTGLGLVIVRTVIEAHGWTIDATDAETGGARFEIAGVRFDEERPKEIK